MNVLCYALISIVLGIIVLIVRFKTNYKLRDNEQPRADVDFFSMPIFGTLFILAGLFLLVKWMGFV